MRFVQKGSHELAATWIYDVVLAVQKSTVYLGRQTRTGRDQRHRGLLASNPGPQLLSTGNRALPSHDHAVRASPALGGLSPLGAPASPLARSLPTVSALPGTGAALACRLCGCIVRLRTQSLYQVL